MSNSPRALVESASAVAALGVCRADIDALDDASVVEGMRLVREHELQLQSYKVWLAAAIAGRSSHTDGYSGLARRSGAATPAVFIQSLTGGSLGEATKLAQLGALLVAGDDGGGEHLGGEHGGSVGGVAVVGTAAASGVISIEAADSIRRGLGEVDEAVTATELETAAHVLMARAGDCTPEALLRLARQARNDLDLAAIERGEKERSSLRYVRRFRRDGMCGGSWLLPDSEGGLELDIALQLLLAEHTGGPRFEAGGDSDTGALDTRTNEQVLADGFAQVFLNGLRADPTVVPGAQRAAVRVLVDVATLERRSGSALLEDSLTAITFPRLEEYLCEGGTVNVVADDNGDIINFGREQRLFTARQRAALAVRDGGCRFPGCAKPPSWAEAHHVRYWRRDHGPTDLSNGILLCRYHHMLIHNNGWEITRNRGTFWLKPPASVDPSGALREMPSSNPLMIAGSGGRRSEARL